MSRGNGPCPIPPGGTGPLVRYVQDDSFGGWWLGLGDVSPARVCGGLMTGAGTSRLSLVSPSEEKDEFQRNLYIQALLCGMAVTLAVVTAWGYMEDFGRAPHLDPVWVCAMFWISTVVSFPLVMRRYRS
jgi:hypothetical protein